MNKEFSLDLLRHMVEIPSVSGQEQHLARYLQTAMTELGLRCQIDEVGNIIGETGTGDGPLILFLGHMDTVAGDIPIRQEGTILYGRGTVDAKGPLATFICTLASLKGIAGRLIVVGAVEEETSGSRGARAILTKYVPDAVVIGEPGGWSSIGLGYKGRVECKYTVTTPVTHSAVPGQTASELAVEFWQSIVTYCHSAEQTSIFYRAIPGLLAIEGTQGSAQVTIDCRIPPTFDIAAFTSYLQQIGKPGEVAIEEQTPAVVVERTNPLAQALSTTIWTYGVRPQPKLKTGTSDMNVISEHWHVPMVAYGPGDSHLDHTAEEHIDLEEYWKAISVLEEAIRLFCTAYPRETEKAQDEWQANDYVYDQEEEEKIRERLQALGYLE